MNFEDELVQVQSSMLEVCLDYADCDVQMIYVAALYNANGIQCEFAFMVDDAIVQRETLQAPKYQHAALKLLYQEAIHMQDVFRRYNQQPPSKVYIDYNMIEEQMEVRYSYDRIVNLQDEMKRWSVLSS